MPDDPLTRARAGDPEGFALLWRGFQPAVLRYLRVIAEEDADDAASETWLQVIRSLPRFEGDLDAFRGWLFRIARNRGIDTRRRRKPVPAILEGPPAAPSDVIHEEQDGTAWAIAIVRTLPLDQAEAVMLRIVAGLDVATTAVILGKKPGAVRVATHRGLRKLASHPQVRDHVPEQV